MKSARNKREAFFGDVLRLLCESGIPFMVGGSHGFMALTKTVRPTKDMDILCMPKDVPRALALFRKAGYGTELTHKDWLAKIYDADSYVDIIFRSSNRMNEVKRDFFDRAHRALVFGSRVQVMSPEDMIVSKLYILSRDCFHGHDVYKIIRALGNRIDWEIIWSRLKKDWQVLYAHVLLFDFVFPKDRRRIPAWLRDELTERASKLPGTSAEFRGNMVSLVDYKTPKQIAALYAHPKKK